MPYLPPNHTVLDIVAAHPETEPVFRSLDEQAGECVLCNALFETVADLCSKYNLNQVELLAELNQIISGDSHD